MFRRKDSFALLFILCITMLFFSPIILGSKTFFVRDLTFIFQPWKTFACEMIQKGEIPLWNSYSFCGMPFLANWQSAVYYPFTLLFYFFSFALALKVFGFFHILLAGIFAFLFARKYGLSRISSSGIMIIAAFNGYIITRLEFLSHIGVDIWIYALLLFISSPVLLALTISLAFLSGHQMFFQVTIIFLLYWIVSINRKIAFRRTKDLFLTAVLSTGMVSCQLLPTIELFNHTVRFQEGIASNIAMMHSLGLSGLFGFISPWLSTAFTDILDWTNSVHVGIFGFFAALYGILRIRDYKKIIFPMSLVLLGIFLSLGSNSILYRWLYDNLIIFRVQRYPVQNAIISITGIAILAGCGLQKLKRNALIVSLITLELICLAWNHQPLAPDKYFDKKPQSVSFLQSIIGNKRFILSPMTDNNRMMRGESIVDAWQNSREFLFNSISVPYHIYNAYGAGEPLTLSGNENYIEKAYKCKSAADSLPYFESLGIKYLITGSKLSSSEGYTLVSQSPIFIYQLNDVPNKYFLKNSGLCSVDVVSDNPGKTVLNINSNIDNEFIWKENYFPGWQVYINKEKYVVGVWENMFRSFNLPAGISKVFQIYRPNSSYYGIIVTLITIFILITYAIKKARNLVLFKSVK